MNQTGYEPFPYTNKWRRVVRLVYAVIPFVVAGALIIASLHLVLFATETSPAYPFAYSGGDEIHIRTNQTYTYNVTISYIEFPPNRLPPIILNESGTIVIEEPVRHDTITSWTRVWLPIEIHLNGNASKDCLINQTLERSNGVIEQGPTVELATSFTGVYPEITQGDTVRLAIENLASVDANVSLSWKTDFHLFDKPYFDYGIAALAIGLLYPVAFLIKQSLGSAPPRLTKPKQD